MVKISWNTETGSWGTRDAGLCTGVGNAAGVGGVLSAWLCKIRSFFMLLFHCDCVWPSCSLSLVSSSFFFLSRVLNVVRNPLLTKAQSMHVTLVMYPQRIRKANRIWQKAGWNWKCLNLLKAAGRGSNNWPQSVNKPNVFTEQHRRWKKTKKKKACTSWHNKYTYITGHIKKN